MGIPELVRILTSVRFLFTNEEELQRGIDDILERNHVARERERRLSEADRIDFFFPGSGVGIEVKIDGSVSALVRQLSRYAQHPEVTGILVVASRVRLANLPFELNGKTITVMSLLPGVG